MRWVGIACGAVALAAPAGATASGLSTSTCHLSGPYKHVVYIQYDNTHLSRDNPNVPSDLEQVPALKDFLSGKGTLSGNHHTPLIAHTAGDIMTSLTGLYPDRNGLAVSNSYLQYAPNSGQLQKTPTGGFFGPTAFTYWTDPVSSPSIPSPGDPLPNLITDGQKNTPAPWVPYTRAGCDVGAFSINGMVLENTGPDIASAFGNPSPQLTFTSRSTDSAGRALNAADFEGIAVHCSQADSANGPDHHGICSAQNGGVADKLPDEPSGYSGFNALFGGIYANQVSSAPGGFTASGQDAAGAANGNINDLAAPVKDVYDYSAPGCQLCANGTNLDYKGNPIVSNVIGDSSGNSGFVSGFSPRPAQTLGYVASLQEAGVPVTYAYIEDAHNNWNPPFQAFGPGEAAYVDQLKQENQAYAAFFERLAADGINKHNTLFVFTADEGDHFAGVSPRNAGCDGVTTACEYPANGVGEQTALINDALSKQAGDNVPFDIHFDDAPNFYVHGAPGSTAPPGPNDPSVRQLEQDLGKLTLTNARSGATDAVTSHIADAVDQSILHMQTTDPLRTPTFTDFANPTYFYQTGSCPASSTTPGCPVVNPSFAWNHGGDQPEVDTTWLGVVGATVRHLGQTNAVWTDHTDVRPTMLSILGLRTDYVQDGAADAQIIRHTGLPSGLRRHVRAYELLAAAYKQLDAAVGQFGHDSEIVSTTAAESSSPGDAVYQGFDRQLATCRTARDALAERIRAAINDAAFNGHPISPSEAAELSLRARQLIVEMHALSRMSTPPRFSVCHA
jgi:hypothetical protein